MSQSSEQSCLFNFILKTLNIKANCVSFQELENYKFYDLELIKNTKIKDVKKFADEISLCLKTNSKPTFKPLYDKGLLRLELISNNSKILNLVDMLNLDPPEGEIMCLLGNTVDNKPLWMDISKNPHLIIAGTTGSGKSTLLHNIISNLYIYNNVSLCLIDPKNIEFVDYGKLENTIIGSSYQDTICMLDALIHTMNSRYDYIRNGTDINDLSSCVFIIDEFADIVSQDYDKQFSIKLNILAQKCRAAKIYIILATQRPSSNIISGNIKSNFPARIALKTVSKVDSRIILDSSGAENLVGNGDALIINDSFNLERFKVAKISKQETFYEIFKRRDNTDNYKFN